MTETDHYSPEYTKWRELVIDSVRRAFGVELPVDLFDGILERYDIYHYECDDSPLSIQNFAALCSKPEMEGLEDFPDIQHKSRFVVTFILQSHKDFMNQNQRDHFGHAVSISKIGQILEAHPYLDAH